MGPARRGGVFTVGVNNFTLIDTEVALQTDETKCRSAGDLRFMAVRDVLF